MKKSYNLAVEATIDVIGGKWKPIILCHLGMGPLRTGELRRKIPQISQRILTKQLRELEADQIIERCSYDQVPPKVKYCLTAEGKSLRTVLLAMSDWGKKLIQQRVQAGQEIELLHPEPTGFEKM